MIASTWNSLFVMVAMTAGMFAQQVAHKFSAASEDNQVGSVGGLELFCSAEDYYLAGHFQPTAAESVTSEAPPALAESNVEPAPAMAQPQPTEVREPAAESADPAPAPAPEVAPDESAPAAPQLASDESPATEAQAETPAEAALPSVPVVEAVPTEPAANMPELTAPAPAKAAPLNADATEVLPPPPPEKELRRAVSQFGTFDERPAQVAPPRTPSRAPLPATVVVPGERTYPEMTTADAGRYVSPAELVRERAVERGEQRRQRIEIRKWLGIIPLRPSVTDIPYTTVEEPQQLLLVVPHVPAQVEP